MIRLADLLQVEATSAVRKGTSEMDLEIVLLSEVRQRKSYTDDVAYMLNLKNWFRVQLPVLYSNFPLAIYFTHGNGYVSMLFSAHPSLSLPYCVHKFEQILQKFNRSLDTQTENNWAKN